jgi:hypothetical protein
MGLFDIFSQIRILSLELKFQFSSESNVKCYVLNEFEETVFESFNEAECRNWIMENIPHPKDHN